MRKENARSGVLSKKTTASGGFLPAIDGDPKHPTSPYFSPNTIPAAASC